MNKVKQIASSKQASAKANNKPCKAQHGGDTHHHRPSQGPSLDIRHDRPGPGTGSALPSVLKTDILLRLVQSELEPAERGEISRLGGVLELLIGIVNHQLVDIRPQRILRVLLLVLLGVEHVSRRRGKGHILRQGPGA